MLISKDKARRATIRMRAKEVELVREIADAEGRSMLGVLALAVRMYAQRKQPALLQKVYGEGA